MTNIGCDSDEHCAFLQIDNDIYFGCEQVPVNVNPVPLEGACTYSAACEHPTALCVPRSSTCGGLCCTASCYVGPTDQDYDACPPGLTCNPLTLVDPFNWAPGIEDFGFCF